jgi:hypothetical protein
VSKAAQHIWQTFVALAVANGYSDGYNRERSLPQAERPRAADIRLRIVTVWLEAMNAGDAQAAQRLWQNYFA